MSFNNFLSTSLNREVSLEQSARPMTTTDDFYGVLFVMTIDPVLCQSASVPFINVKNEGFYGGAEKEILFSTHTIFRIGQIKRIEDNDTDRLWEVKLTLVGNEDQEMKKLTESVREEHDWALNGLARLGSIFHKIGAYDQAEYLFQHLLDRESDKITCASYYHNLGWVYDSMGKYSKALSSYERSFEIRKVALPPNHPSLADSYNNIRSEEHNIGKEWKAR